MDIYRFNKKQYLKLAKHFKIQIGGMYIPGSILRSPTGATVEVITSAPSGQPRVRVINGPGAGSEITLEDYDGYTLISVPEPRAVADVGANIGADADVGANIGTNMADPSVNDLLSRAEQTLAYLGRVSARVHQLHEELPTLAITDGEVIDAIYPYEHEHVYPQIPDAETSDKDRRTQYNRTNGHERVSAYYPERTRIFDLTLVNIDNNISRIHDLIEQIRSSRAENIGALKAELETLLTTTNNSRPLRDYLDRPLYDYSFFRMNDHTGKYQNIDINRVASTYVEVRNQLNNCFRNILSVLDSLSLERSMITGKEIVSDVLWPIDLPDAELNNFTNPRAKAREDMLDSLNDEEGRLILSSPPDKAIEQRLKNIRNMLKYILLTLYVRQFSEFRAIMNLFIFLGSEHEFELSDLKWLYEFDYDRFFTYDNWENHDNDSTLSEEERALYEERDYNDRFDDDDDEYDYEQTQARRWNHTTQELRRINARRESRESRERRRIAEQHARQAEYDRRQAEFDARREARAERQRLIDAERVRLDAEYNAREADRVAENDAYYSLLMENISSCFAMIGYTVEFTQNVFGTRFCTVRRNNLRNYEYSKDNMERAAKMLHGALIDGEPTSQTDSYYNNLHIQPIDCAMIQNIFDIAGRKSFYDIDEFIRNIYSENNFADIMVFDREALMRTLFILLSRPEAEIDILLDIRRDFGFD